MSQPQMDSKKLAPLCRDLAENRKAENIGVLDGRPCRPSRIIL